MAFDSLAKMEPARYQLCGRIHITKRITHGYFVISYHCSWSQINNLIVDATKEVIIAFLSFSRHEGVDERKCLMNETRKKNLKKEKKTIKTKYCLK